MPMASLGVSIIRQSGQGDWGHRMIVRINILTFSFPLLNMRASDRSRDEQQEQQWVDR